MLASVLIWSTVITPLQVAGYTLATVGLLYYSLGVEIIHSFFEGRIRRTSHGDENPLTRRRHQRRMVAITSIVFIISAGAIGGILAGYSVEWDPRVYWYSMGRLAGPAVISAVGG